jgi:predicted dienelactone hydrolase
VALPSQFLRRIAAVARLGAVVVAVVLVAACTGQPSPRPAARSSREPTARPGAHDQPVAGTLGTEGSFRVGTRRVAFTEPAHAGAAGARLGPRRLATLVRYPLARPIRAANPARGRFPLLVFDPGFMQCAGPYSGLLQAWASAGYVVAAVDFPRTDCRVGAAADEADLINQPADMSYVISGLLARSAHPHDIFSGLVDSGEGV